MEVGGGDKKNKTPINTFIEEDRVMYHFIGEGLEKG